MDWLTTQHVINQAQNEVKNGQGPSDTTNLSASLRQTYEAERTYQEKKQKEG
jgi:hypothetical protein